MDWATNRCAENTYHSYMMKIKIAAAIYVIKSKPPEFGTSRNYAMHLQNTFLGEEQDWHQIFEEEKESLILDLINISEVNPSKLLIETQSDSTDSDEDSDDDILEDEDSDNDEILEDDDTYENSYQNTTTFKSNIEFIEALVHIKTATNLKNSILSGKFHALLSRVSRNLTQNSNAPKSEFVDELLCNRNTTTCSRSSKPVDSIEELLTRYSQNSTPEDYEDSPSSDSAEIASEDSGYNSSSPPLPTAKHTHVLSTDVHQVIRNNRADLTLAKSVQLVLHSVTKLVQAESLKEDPWRSGSMLETSVKSIVSLVDCLSEHDKNNDCRYQCFNFVKRLIETIPTVEDEKARNLKCTVIRALSVSPYICTDCITCLINQLAMWKESICITLNMVGEKRSELCHLDLMDEDGFYFLYQILKDLLIVFATRRKQILVEKIKKKESEDQKSKNVRPLTMYAAWKGNLQDEDVDWEEKKMVTEWRVVLEEVNSVLSIHLTNVMFLNYECLCLLEEDSRLSDATGKGVNLDLQPKF